jgi:hypothetical protein
MRRSKNKTKVIIIGEIHNARKKRGKNLEETYSSIDYDV